MPKPPTHYTDDELIDHARFAAETLMRGGRKGSVSVSGIAALILLLATRLEKNVGLSPPEE